MLNLNTDSSARQDSFPSSYIVEDELPPKPGNFEYPMESNANEITQEPNRTNIDRNQAVIICDGNNRIRNISGGRGKPR